MDFLPITRALLSVTDKSGLTEFAAFLVENGVELISTGGTWRMLSQAGLPVTPVSEVTGFPEIMGGRVKTLHPHIHGGILADKDNPEHLAALKGLGIRTLDLVCVNLYNFSDAAARGLDLRRAVEEIDIGGPCMLRATAKNFHSMLVLPDPADYPAAMRELQRNNMCVGLELRRSMAMKTFHATATYDAMIATYLGTDTPAQGDQS